MDRTASRRGLGIAIVAAIVLAPVGALAALVSAPPPSQLAYIDPGSGSFILQALVATVAGAAVAINAYWRKIKQLLGIDTSRTDDETTDPAPSDD